MPYLRHTLRHALQLTRFAAVGLFCFALGIGVLTGLHEWAGVHYLIAYGASFVVSSTAGYLLNARFTFGTATHGPGVLRYMTTNGVLLLINGAGLHVLVEYYHLWYLGATFVLAVINTPVSFLAHWIFSYRLKLSLTPDRVADSGR